MHKTSPQTPQTSSYDCLEDIWRTANLCKPMQIPMQTYANLCKSMQKQAAHAWEVTWQAMHAGPGELLLLQPRLEYQSSQLPRAIDQRRGQFSVPDAGVLQARSGCWLIYSHCAAPGRRPWLWCGAQPFVAVAHFCTLCAHSGKEVAYTTVQGTAAVQQLPVSRGGLWRSLEAEPGHSLDALHSADHHCSSCLGPRAACTGVAMDTHSYDVKQTISCWGQAAGAMGSTLIHWFSMVNTAMLISSSTR